MSQNPIPEDLRELYASTPVWDGVRRTLIERIGALEAQNRQLREVCVLAKEYGRTQPHSYRSYLVAAAKDALAATEPK